MSKAGAISVAALSGFLLSAVPLVQAREPALSGEQAFAACAACHSLSEGAAHKVGPNLYGVSGRPAASADGYSYSPALRESGLVWNRANLFTWIAGSEALVPGSWMLYHNALRPDEVLSLIDYLDAQTETAGEPPGGDR